MMPLKLLICGKGQSLIRSKSCAASFSRASTMGAKRSLGILRVFITTHFELERTNVLSSKEYSNEEDCEI